MQNTIKKNTPPSKFGLKHFLFSALMLLSAGTAWADVEINETNFPDASFRNYLLSQDYGSDGKLTDEEIAGVTSINVSGTYLSPGTISSLKGIEFFTALEDLRCSDNQLNSLDVSGCTALTTLFCYNNQLTSLDVSKNTALTWLQCDNNQLTSLDVSKNTALTRLECYDNPLTSLDVSKNTALETLSCGSNQLTSLDVSKNTALIYLDCFDNQLTSLDVSKNTALTELACDGNQLTSLDVSNNAALTSLGCDNNQLTSLDVSKNAALTELGCYGNQLTSLDVSKNTALTSLSCSGNQLTSLDVSKNTALTRLWCNENQLTSLDVSKNTALTYLVCYQNKIKGEAMDALVENLPTVSSRTMLVKYFENEQNVMTTTQVAAAKAKGWIPYYTENGADWKEYAGVDPVLEGIAINETNFPDASFRNYLLNQSYGSDGKLTDEEIAGVTNINVSGTYGSPGTISSLKGIEYFTALTSLNCGANQLTSLDVSGCTALTELVCVNNQLTSLDVSKNTALKSLACSNNQLTSLDVSKNTALTLLWCFDNPLTSLDVSKNTALTSLDCDGNQLTSLDVSKNTALTKLSCDNNQLTSLDVSKNTALTLLDCSGNQLTFLDVSGNTALTELYCYNNQLTSLDVSGCTALTKLVCDNNQLTSLDVSGCTALKTLSCAGNQLTSLDVSGNTALTRLYCYQNQIKGAAMDALVASLPKVMLGDIVIIYNEDEQNEMMSAQVTAAKAKGWKPWKYNGQEFVAYTGVLPPMPDLTPEELLKIDMISSDMLGWFVDEETKIQGSNVNVTKNINLAETKYKTGSIQTADGKTHPYSYFYVPSASTINPNVGFYLPYNLKGEYDIYLVTMPTWTYQNNFDEEKRRYRFRASIWEKDEQNNFPSTGTALTVDGNNTFVTPEVDANVITDTTFIGTYDFQHAYTDNLSPGVILQINPVVLSSQRKTYSNSMIFAGVVLVAKDVEPQTGIAINEENFPDENFRNYLLSQSFGSDGVLTDEEIAGVTEINVIYEGIQSLKGIEFFTALTRLDCPNNQLTSLDVSGCTALTELYCYNNQLTSLDVSKNTALTRLDCPNNQLTSLDVSGNTALTRLECDNNQLTSLDVSGCTALTELYCPENHLTSLDVSKNAALKGLYCYRNQLTSLDVSNNTALTELYCYNNQLTSLDVSKNTELTRLDCPNNHLTSLDLSKNTALTSLSCFMNQIKDAAMDALVASLPTVTWGTMSVVFNENEQNVMTTTQVAAAKAKGWIPYYTEDGNVWKEYAGVDPSTGVNNVEAADADDSAPWYTINGTLLSGKPTEKGIYIHNGKKVVVK